MRASEALSGRPPRGTPLFVSSDSYSTKIVNLTPHDVGLLSDGDVRVYSAAGPPVRVRRSRYMVGQVAGIPLVEWSIDGIDDLPPGRVGRHLIVSETAALAAGWREDLLVPVDLVRGPDGTVSYAAALGRPATSVALGQ